MQCANHVYAMQCTNPVFAMQCNVQILYLQCNVQIMYLQYIAMYKSCFCNVGDAESRPNEGSQREAGQREQRHQFRPRNLQDERGGGAE